MKRSLSESWDDESVGHDISDCFYFGKLYKGGKTKRVNMWSV